MAVALRLSPALDFPLPEPKCWVTKITPITNISTPIKVRNRIAPGCLVCTKPKMPSLVTRMRSFKLSPEKSSYIIGADPADGRGTCATWLPFGDSTTASSSPTARIASTSPFFLRGNAVNVEMTRSVPTPSKSGDVVQNAVVATCQRC